MAENRYKYTIDLITRDAQANARALERAVDEAGESLDETGSKGKRLAQALRDATDKATADLDQTDRAAEALARTLGAGMNADDAVRRLQSLGLTLDEIEADADELGAALRRADEQASRAAGNVDDGFRRAGQSVDGLSTSTERLRTESDKTGSVMANTVGNASQDLAASLGIANIAGGTLGVTIGQLGEYAAEGGISLRELAKQAGPMLAVTAGVALIGAAIARHKEEQQEFRDTVKDTREALEALGAVDPSAFFRLEAYRALIDASSETSSEMDELRKQADDAGLSAASLATALSSGKEALARLLVEQARAKGIGRAFQSSIDEGTESYVGMENATEEQTEAFRNLWDVWQQGDDVIRANEQAVQQNQTAVRGLLDDAAALETFLRQSDPDSFRNLVDPELLAELRKELEAGGTGVQTFTKYSDDLYALIGSRGVGAFGELIDLARDAGDEVDDTADALERMKAKYEALTGSLDRVQAWESVKTELAELRAQGIEAFEAAASGAEDATQKADEYKAKVLDTIGSLVDYGQQIDAIPESKLTTVQALVDRGAYDEALGLLEILTRNRTVSLDIIARGGAGYDGGTAQKPRANGGPASGRTLIDERGPEIVDLPVGSYVNPASSTNRLMRERSAPVVNNYTTINPPAGATPSQVRAADRRWQRRNGPG